jgi:sugar phosphate isomerase/epimerase
MAIRHLFHLILAVSLGASALAEPEAAAPFRAGCASYTFNRFTAYEAVEKTSQAGGTVIEFLPGQTLSPTDPAKISPDLTDAQINALLGHLKENRVVATSYYTDIPKDEDQARKVFEFARRMKLQTLTTESDGSINTIEKLVKEFNIGVGFHEHAKNPNDPNYKLWDPQFVYELVKDRDVRIGACADTGHWATSGLVPLDALKILDGRIVSLHLKDRKEIGHQTTDQILGLGLADIAGILQELRRKKFDGCIYIEYEANWDNSVPDVKHCLDFIRKNSRPSNP